VDKKMFRSLTKLIIIAALSILLVWKISIVTDSLKLLLSVASPVVIGFIIAFILNRPYEGIYKFCSLLRVKKSKDIDEYKKSRIVKVIALILTFCLFFGLVVLVFVILIPRLIESTEMLMQNKDTYLSNLRAVYNWVYTQMDVTGIATADIDKYLQDAYDNALLYLRDMLPLIFSFTQSVVSVFTKFFFGIFISIYFLYDKDHLITQIKQLLLSYVPIEVSKKVLYVGRIANETFSGFITGQLTEAFILGILCFVTLFLLRFPFALLISIIIGISNLVPIFGPIIGTIPGTFLLLMVNPIQGIWFIVISFLLQQVDGKIIYPKVVGGSVGLPALWVLIAVMIGGGLFGILGMIVAVPSTSVAYKLLKENTAKVLKEKKIDVSKY